MIVRLVLVDPDVNEGIVPTVALEDEHGLRLLGDDWIIRVPETSLEKLTVEQVKCALTLPSHVAVLLSDSRTLPDFEWLSPEMLEWFGYWRTEALTERRTTELVPVVGLPR